MIDPSLTFALRGNRHSTRVNRHWSPRDLVLSAVAIVADTAAVIEETHAGIIEGEPELDDARAWLSRFADALHTIAERIEEMKLPGVERGFDPWREGREKDATWEVKA